MSTGDADSDINAAAERNTTIVAEMARQDPRYRADANRKVPTRIDSQLVIFDCITCDKCVPVCPNAANFTYPVPKVEFDFYDIEVDPGGNTSPIGAARRFKIDQEHQIANYADFCNECGNCDTFCPEYGGPYIRKPGFYGSRQSWEAARPRDGFVVTDSSIIGRIKGNEFELTHDRAARSYRFACEGLLMTLSDSNHEIQSAITTKGRGTVDMGIYHTLRHLLHGILDARSIHQVNAGVLAPGL